MAQKKTKTDYENYLNELYHQDSSWRTVKNAFIYLTNKSRGKHITEKTLENAYHKGTIGTLLKKLDPVAFTVGLNDWSR